MSKMNIKAGLWRLWVVFALSWVISCAFIQRDELFNMQISTFGGTAPPCVFKDKAVTGKFLSEDQAFGRCEPWQRDWGKFNIQKLPDGVEIREDGTFWFLRTLNWSSRLDAAKWIFIPPLGILLFGLGIGWVVKGFSLPA